MLSYDIKEPSSGRAPSTIFVTQAYRNLHRLRRKQRSYIRASQLDQVQRLAAVAQVTCYYRQIQQQWSDDRTFRHNEVGCAVLTCVGLLYPQVQRLKRADSSEFFLRCGRPALKVESERWESMQCCTKIITKKGLQGLVLASFILIWKTAQH